MSRVFDPSASWIPKQLKKPVKEALDAGWTPGKDRIKAGGWFIYSPKRTEKFYVPITCRDPDNVAKKLRALISDAYIKEGSAFEPNVGDHRLAVGIMSGLAHQAILDGATIIPGPDPIIRCPVCDDEFTGWDAFANHQGPCNAKAALADVVPEPDVPAEDVLQTATESTEPVQSGTIGTKEETPLASEDTVTPPPAPKKRAKKGGYTWTHVEEPLHKLLYEAIRYTRRWKGETDSKWAKRLAQYIDEEGLLNTLVFEVDADAKAAHVLDQIRELLGEEQDSGPSEEEIEQFKQDIATRDQEIETLSAKVTELRGVLTTLSSLAEETNK